MGLITNHHLEHMCAGILLVQIPGAQGMDMSLKGVMLRFELRKAMKQSMSKDEKKSHFGSTKLDCLIG